jgi:hypothetical protein
VCAFRSRRSLKPGALYTKLYEFLGVISTTALKNFELFFGS